MSPGARYVPGRGISWELDVSIRALEALLRRHRNRTKGEIQSANRTKGDIPRALRTTQETSLACPSQLLVVTWPGTCLSTRPRLPCWGD